jgi:hypothetical protein
MEGGFLEAHGDAGRHFYTGLGWKTEWLKELLEAILRLEQPYAHEDVSFAPAVDVC